MNALRARPVCYSPSLHYVFIHIPKCAGTSMHRALHSLHEQRALPLPPKKYHKHTKAVRAREILGLAAWHESFKFAFVRNPWDLMVSSYHWWLRYAEEFSSLRPDVACVRAMDFSHFMQSEYGRTMLNEHAGADLFEWLADDKGIILDFVGRFEALANDWLKVCRALNVSSTPLPHENRVVRRNSYREFYTDETREIVARRFARTIGAFGYEF